MPGQSGNLDGSDLMGCLGSYNSYSDLLESDSDSYDSASDTEVRNLGAAVRTSKSDDCDRNHRYVLQGFIKVSRKQKQDGSNLCQSVQNSLSCS
jgi:hypothetical protein